MRPFASPIQPAQQGINLTGVSLSDLVRLYLERIDGRSYVACSDLVQDARLVSMRADKGNLREAIVGVLKHHGYELTQQGGVTYVCPAAQKTDSDQLLTVPSLANSPETASAKSAPVSPPSAFASFAAEGDGLVDRLSHLGYEPAGCIDTREGVRVAMKGGTRTIMVSISEVRKSGISPLVQCRV